jgi:hypothetical protein
MNRGGKRERFLAPLGMTHLFSYRDLFGAISVLARFAYLEGE